MFEKILSAIAQILDQNKIPYMVIGGQALLQYGSPRLTEDIDITLSVGAERNQEIIEIVHEIDLVPLKEATADFIEKTNVLPCLDRSTRIRVDFIFSFLPYEKEAIARGKKVSVGGATVNFATAEDLIIHKMFAGRPRDLEDVRNVLVKQEKNLDLNYIKKNLAEFSKLEGFQQLLKDFEKLI